MKTGASGKVTLQVVADKAKVSKMTVSLSLRNHPSISAATRERVQRLAREMGYHPNPLVSALMANLRRVRKVAAPPTIAFIIASHGSALARNEMAWARLYTGARDRAEQLGYQIERFSLVDMKLTPLRLAAILQARGIRALIISPFARPVDDFELPWSQFACAAIGRTLLRPELHRAHNNQYHSVMLAFDRATSHGCRRIGLALERLQNERVEHWWTNGFKLARERHGMPASHCPIHMPEVLEERKLMQWFRAYRPEVVLGVNDRALQLLAKGGVRVPDDAGFIVLDLQRNTAGCTGVDQNHHLIGAAAVDIIIEQLHSNESGVPNHPKSVMIEGQWVAGKTLHHRLPAGGGRKGRIGSGAI